MLKTTTVPPPGTVTEAGTAAIDGAELDKLTTTPPEGAGAFRITTFEGEVPTPTMVDGTSITVRVWAPKIVFSTFCER
jgi:hypothetical protein